MREVTVHKTGGGQLFVYIPKAIERHFGIQEGQKVYADWDESNPKNPRIVYYLKKPDRLFNLSSVSKESEEEASTDA